MKLIVTITAFFLIFTGCAALAQLGVEITPGQDGVFVYSEDFKTQRFLTDGFVTKIGPEQWSPGAISNAGPDSGRMLTYRFYGNMIIEGVDAAVQQRANFTNSGGFNVMFVSSNGLDWIEVARSSNQKASASGWQSEPFILSSDHAKAVTGGAEFWVRVTLNNSSGLKTNISSSINGIDVSLRLGKKAKISSGSSDKKAANWDRLRKSKGWQVVSLDADDRSSKVNCYFEDCDGLLCSDEENPLFAWAKRDGFYIQRASNNDKRIPLSLAAFVKTDASNSPTVVSVTVLRNKDSSRKMSVSWDGKLLGSFDIANYFDKEQVFSVELPYRNRGTHEVRIAGADSGSVLIKKIALEGTGSLSWIARPALPSGGELKVISAYYMADPLPPAASQAVEGRVNVDKSMVDLVMGDQKPEPEKGLVFSRLQRMYEAHADFGAVRVVVHNPGKAPIRIIGDLLFNGKPIAESYVDFVKSEWDAPGVVWYRVRPRLINPGEAGQIYVRFRCRPAGDSATIGIPLEGGKIIDVKIPYQAPNLAIDYVTTGESMDDLFVYVRRLNPNATPTLTNVTLDGVPIDGVKSHGGFYGDVAMFTAKLAKPLKLGDYHVIGVGDGSGDAVAAQFRVQRFFFPRSSIHIDPAKCGELNMNLQMWHPVSQETCEKYGIYTLTNSPFDTQPRALYIMGPDEPDAKDNRGGGYDRGLGSHARRLSDVGWQELIVSQAPSIASWIIMNGTTRPLNWFVYGQLADISCFDPYPVTYYGADHAYVRESLSIARMSGAPNRMFACLEAYGWSKGQGVPSGARGPIPAEWRQNVVQALGEGAKGLTSWVYTANAAGFILNPEFGQEVGKVNTLIEQIEDYLLVGTPVYGVATNDAGTVLTGRVGAEIFRKDRVALGCLLCGPSAMIITASNHIPASKPEPPVIEPAEAVTITFDLPKFASDFRAFEVTENGQEPVKSEIVDGKCNLKIDSIESGKVFLVKWVGSEG